MAKGIEDYAYLADSDAKAYLEKEVAEFRSVASDKSTYTKSTFSEPLSHKPLHPLLTKGQNKHYDKKGKSTISSLEKELTVIEMIGFCKGNIGKYTLREKGSNNEDKKKAKKYNNYLYMLEKLPSFCSFLSVFESWEKTRQYWRYN